MGSAFTHPLSNACSFRFFVPSNRITCHAPSNVIRIHVDSAKFACHVGKFIDNSLHACSRVVSSTHPLRVSSCIGITWLFSGTLQKNAHFFTQNLSQKIHFALLGCQLRHVSTLWFAILWSHGAWSRCCLGIHNHFHFSVTIVFFLSGRVWLSIYDV